MILTCVAGELISTRLSIVKTNAAVLPVPLWDWAIMFCGLKSRRVRILRRYHNYRNSTTYGDASRSGNALS